MSVKLPPLCLARVQRAAMLVIVIGSLVLAGWVLDVSWLKTLSFGGLSMKANTALCFVLLGFALYCDSRSDTSRSLMYLTRSAALLAAMTGLLTLIEYISGWNAGIDQWMFTEPAVTAGTYMPGRMAPDSALSLLLLGAALVINGMAKKSAQLVAVACSLLVAAFAMAAMFSCLTPVLGAYGWFGYSVMALHTAMLFLLLGIVIAWLSWQKGRQRWSLSKSATLAFALGLVWLALIGLNTSRSQIWIRDKSRQIVNSQMVLGDLQGILIAAIDAQTHVRGYALTGEARFYSNFVDAQVESYRKIDALNLLVKDTPLERHQVEQIENQVWNNLQWLQQIILLDRNAYNADVRNKLLLHGEDLLDGLRDTLSRIESEHQQYVAGLQKQMKEVAHFSNLFIVAGTLASLMIFLISLLKLNLSEARGRRLTNLYAALSQCNQSIVRSGSSQELFAQVCSHAVKFGGMQLAWIGMKDEAKKQVQPVAYFGDGPEYLTDFVISVDENHPEGGGPVAKAIRENRPYWCQDFQSDPLLSPWHERARRFGWGSAAALPLECNGAIVGVFVLYARDKDAFDDEARNLLAEMATDISFALNTFADADTRKTMELALQEQRSLIEMAGRMEHIGGWAVELPDMRVLWSDEVCAIHDMPVGTQPTLEQAINFYTSDSAGKIQEAVSQCIREATPFDREFQIITAKNRPVWVRIIGQAVHNSSGAIIRIQGAFQDISELKQAELEKQANEVRFQLLFESMVTGFALHEIICDEQGKPVDYRFLEVNPAFESLTGLSAVNVIDRTALEVLPGLESALIERYGEVALTGKSSQFEYFAQALGKYFEVIAYAPRTGQFVTLFSDTTERKHAEERIRRLAHFDALTGLPNRISLIDRTKYAISLTQRNDNSLSVMFLDLDRFKNINDTLGHDVGDELLMEVSKRLKTMVRDDDTISRLGGDEFILLLPDTNALGAANVARKLLALFSGSFLIAGHEIVITPSIGIAMYPGDGHDFESLSKSADIAMFQAKQEGRNDFRFYAQEMQAGSVRALMLSTALRHALSLDQLQLHYQPQVCLTDGSIIGVEALLRWQHPEFGEVSPGEFIPIAEDSGQIVKIGEWVLRTAVLQLKHWLDSGLPPMVMAVNLSAVQFRHANLPELVANILEQASLPPQYLELELTEGVAMSDPFAAIATMNNLHEQGIRMSIDDFGTGYSSLSYLKKFKVYKLKIDQSFVRDIHNEPEDKAIVAAIISMAGSLGMKTIAEGVETAEQMAFLRLQGCNEVQGYYFSRPLPALQFEAYVRSTGL